LRSSQSPFGPEFTGGIRTATGDVNGDGIADLIVGTGPGRPTLVRVLDGVTNAELFAISPFEERFQGGVFVSAGDLNGDGRADFVITPDEGGGARARVFDGASFQQIVDFFGIDDPAFRGGARAAIGDLTGDGRGELIVSAGFGGGPRVTIWNGAALSQGVSDGATLANFFAFEPALRNGSYVAAGDMDGDGRAEVVFGAGPGGGPRVRIFSGQGLANAGNLQSLDQIPEFQQANFFGGDVENRAGIRVAVKNLDNDPSQELLVGPGQEAGNRVTTYAGETIRTGRTPQERQSFDAFDGLNGIFVG